MYYSDVIMGAMAYQITRLTIVYSTVNSGEDKKNIKAPRHWPLCGEFTGDRWIPGTNGQYRRRCCNLMTSSWNLANNMVYVYSWFFTPHYHTNILRTEINFLCILMLKHGVSNLYIFQEMQQYGWVEMEWRIYSSNSKAGQHWSR